MPIVARTVSGFQEGSSFQIDATVRERGLRLTMRAVKQGYKCMVEQTISWQTLEQSVFLSDLVSAALLTLHQRLSLHVGGGA